MKITYNINLDGRVFTIDEDAYRLLDDYLETLKHAFNNSENKEIVADIEARISEVFFINQEEGKSVVTLQDVEAVITRIGHPEELIEEVDETVVEEGEKVEVKVESVLPPPPPIQAPKPVKRLYRDSSNGMIGGVCAGLAEYLNVDVTWVRLIAVALCFVSLSTLALAYLILWIVLPNAETPYQRMQMSGESPTLQNIGQSVKNFFKSRNGDTEKSSYSQSFSQTAPPTPHKEKNFFDNLADFFGVLAKILLFLLLIVCLPIEVSLAIGLIGCIIGLIALTTAAGTAFFIEIPYFNNLAVEQLIALIVAALGFILFIGIPLFLLIRILLNGDKNPMKTSTKIIALISWVIAIVITVVAGIIFYATYYGFPV
ncbi:MAG: PspC domain-containing protein [Muribaculaceae bacterium]|nr:PspC domain-containing protein [Muribaculaceae bacterium]